MTQTLTADAEQAKSLGAMVALLPSAESVQDLIVEGGEPAEDLHLTLSFIGSDVSHLSGPDSLIAAAQGIARELPVFQANAFAHAVFNPGSGEACAVYLVGDAFELVVLHQTLSQVAIEEYGAIDHHPIFFPHVTAGYGIEPSALRYCGPVVFDHLVVTWQEGRYYFPLAGAIQEAV